MSGSDIDKLLHVTEAGFIHMPVPDDGNCFYHSLATYLRMLQVPGLRDMSIGDLRRVTTEYMEAHIDELVGLTGEKSSNYNALNEEYWTINPQKKRLRLKDEIAKIRKSGVITKKNLNKFTNDPSNKNGERVNLERKEGRIIGLLDTNSAYDAFKTSQSNYNKTVFNPKKKGDRILREINKLKKDGVWASELGDFVPVFAARNLNITLHIHDWRWEDRVINTITVNECEQGGPAGGAGAAAGAPRECITVNVLRVNDGHFEVIFPTVQFKGTAKAIGGRELALMSKYDAEKTFELVAPTMKRMKIATSAKDEYTAQFVMYLSNAERGLEYINEASTNAGANASQIAECRAIAEASIAQIRGFISRFESVGSSAPVKKKGASSPARKKGATRRKNSVNKNVEKLTKQLESAKLSSSSSDSSNSSGSSSSGITSARRRSTRIAEAKSKPSTLGKRPPTPPKKTSGTYKKSTLTHPAGSVTKKNNSAKYRAMSNQLISVGVNITGFTKKQIQDKYSEFFEN